MSANLDLKELDQYLGDQVQKIKGMNVNFLPEKEKALDYLSKELSAGDLLLIFTAGDAIEINQQLEQILSR